MSRQLGITACAAFLLAASVTLMAQSHESPDAPINIERISTTPAISPSGTGFASAGSFNPAAVRHSGKIVLLYRAQDKNGTSTIGYAESKDGVHFTSKEQPVFLPEAAYEKDGGVEDPRIVKFGKTYYMTYTGYNKKDAQLCLATSTDLIHGSGRESCFPRTREIGMWAGRNQARSFLKRWPGSTGCI